MQRVSTALISLTDPSPGTDEDTRSSASKVRDEGGFEWPTQVTSSGGLVLPVRAIDFLASQTTAELEELKEFGVVKIMAAVGPINERHLENLDDGEEGIILFVRDMTDDEQGRLPERRTPKWLEKEPRLPFIFIPESQLPHFRHEPSALPDLAPPGTLPSLVLEPDNSAAGSFVTPSLPSNGHGSHSKTTHRSKLLFRTEPPSDCLAGKEKADQSGARQHSELAEARGVNLQRRVLESDITVELDPVSEVTEKIPPRQKCNIQVVAASRNCLRRVKVETFNMQGLDHIKWSTYPYRRTWPGNDDSSEVHGYPLGAQKKRLSRGEEFILAPGDNFGGRVFRSGSVGVELTTDGRALEEGSPVVFGIDVISTLFSRSSSRAYYCDTDFVFQFRHTVHVPLHLKEDTDTSGIVVLQHTNQRANMAQEEAHATLPRQPKRQTMIKGQSEVVEESSGSETSIVGRLRQAFFDWEAESKEAEDGEGGTEGSGLTRYPVVSSATIRIAGPDPTYSS